MLSTQVLNQVIASLNHPPAVWLNASTATIYRHSLDRPMDEATGELGGNEPGAPDTWNFSISVAKAWEEAFFSTPTLRTRKVALRSAMTFSPDPGGVFDVFLSLVRHGLGAPISPAINSSPGSTKWTSSAPSNSSSPCRDFAGVVNLASPHPLPNRDFLRAIRDAWGTCVGLPTTSWMIEIGTFLMRTESELVLKSRQVVPGRLLAAGFQFTFPDWPWRPRISSLAGGREILLGN